MISELGAEHIRMFLQRLTSQRSVFEAHLLRYTPSLHVVALHSVMNNVCFICLYSVLVGK